MEHGPFTHFFPLARVRVARVPPARFVSVAGAALLLAAACGAPPAEHIADDLGAAYGALADAAEARGAVAVAGREGWRFDAAELRHLAGGALDAAEPLAAILAFDRALAARGVELLVAPVPPKALLYADKVALDEPAVPVPVPRLDPHHRAFYALLAREGVDVLDLTERFLDDRFHGEGPLYCRQDRRWSGVGCVVAAQEIAAVVRARPWFAELATEPYRYGWRTTTIDGDLVRGLEPRPPREELRLRGIVAAGAGRPAPVAPDPASPVTLLGDSHALVFHAGDGMHAAGAGLADQLTYELGLPIDLVAGATPGAARAAFARRAESDPGVWEGKRLVIWCFAARTLSEPADWRAPAAGD